MKIKPVPEDVLKAFGFKRTSRTKNFTWFNKNLNIYYDPDVHTMRNFANNLMYASASATINAVYGNLGRLAPKV